MPEPTSIPLLEKEADFEIKYSGDDCKVTGPTKVSAGEHTFKFIQSSDLKGELYLIYLRDGKTFQDLLDGQSEPGEWYQRPSWYDYDTRVSFEYETVEDNRVIIATIKLDKVGEHAIICIVRLPQKQFWLVAPVTVEEISSE